jgi:hypothetical protein
MKKIYELSKLTGKFEKTLITMIPNKDSSPLKKLATIAFSGIEITEEECMNRIYGKRNMIAFSSLKSRLLDKLSLLAIMQEVDQGNKKEYFIQRIDNLKRIVSSNIILANGKLELGLKMLEKAIEVSIKQEYTENVIISSRRLIIGFGSEMYNKYKHKKYLDIQSKYITIYMWELKAQNYFFELQKTNINSLTIPNENLINKTIKFIEELEGANEIETSFFLHNKYRINAIYCEYVKDYNKLLNISNQRILELAPSKDKFPRETANIKIRILLALIQLEKLDEAISFGKKAISKIIPSSNTWFRINYYIIKAYMYTGKYVLATQLILQIKSKDILKKFPNYNEIISTLLGYTHLLINSKYFKPTLKILNSLPDFKLGKYLNSVPIYSRDKYGINVSILLLHIAFLLQRKDYNTIIDRIDSLKQYAYRYLRRDDSFRSNCMIKMVVQMTKADFHPVRTERYTADLLKQLKSVKLAGSGENIEIEVLPFEVLWDIMLKSLKD